MIEMNEKTPTKTSWSVALAAGGAAGTAVDVALFPLDTVKTRLQSDVGFFRYVHEHAQEDSAGTGLNLMILK